MVSIQERRRILASLSGSLSAGEIFALISSGAVDTRASIARVTGLSRSTVSERLDALFDARLIREAADAQPTGGRPSKTLQVNEDGFLALAADVGEDHIRLVVTDLNAGILAESVTAIAVTEGPSVALEWIAAEARKLVTGLSRTVDDLLGLGLSVPAPVDFAHGEVVAPSVMTGWDGVDIQAEFRRLLDIPVLVENDVNARGLGEFLLAWRNYDQVFYVKAGTGIGSAILTGGSLFRGAQGAAGDVGHIRLEPQDGPLCRCGAIGCVEALGAGWAINRDLSGAGFAVESTRDSIELVRAGKPEAIHRIRESGRIIGRAIAYCVNLLNPSLVVVGGSLTEAGEHLLMGVRESVYQYSLPLATRELEVVRAQGDDRCGAVGAAHLVISRALEPDRVNDRIRLLQNAGAGSSNSSA